MHAYLARRLLGSVVTIWIIVSASFLIIRLAPGDPAQIWLGDYATPDLLQVTRARMGLDRPLPVQYLTYLGSVMRGDLGESLRSRKPVAGEIRDQLPYSLDLMVTSTLLSVAIGLTAGVIAAVKRNSMVDVLAMSVALFFLSIPAFWLGLLLFILFSAHLEWFPLIGAGNRASPANLAYHLVLPTLALGSRIGAVVARMTRSSVIEALSEDFVRPARAKGLSEPRVWVRHALRNAATPILSIVGIQVNALMGGSAVVEAVFSRPGVGNLLIVAISTRDYPMVQGAIFLIAVGVVLVNLLTDVAYGLADPRIRYA
ncbi:MAG: ABC transporter permease [Armatimonadetes bacterium]|nr:ABC transporter permease [Armatimonadota bacterium]